MNFIKTSFEDTALELRKLGYQEMPKEGKYYVFINSGNKVEFDNKKVIYTNNLFI